MKKLIFFIIFTCLIHSIIGTNSIINGLYKFCYFIIFESKCTGYFASFFLAKKVLEQYNKDLDVVKQIIRNGFPVICSVLINATRISGQRRISSQRSEMKHLYAETATAINTGSIQQKQQTSEFSKMFSSSTSITTTNTEEFSNEISVGFTTGASGNIPFLFEVKAEASVSYKHGWGQVQVTVERKQKTQKPHTPYPHRKYL